MTKTVTKKLSRRNFIAGAAVLGAGAMLAGCSPKGEAEPEAQSAGDSFSETADVLIIGAGLAGSACARAAAEGGAHVIMVDKAPFIGTTFQISKGNVSICQIPENEEFWQFVAEETDSMDAFLERYKKATETGKVDAPYPDYDRVKMIMTESCETIQWAEGVGVDFIQSLTKEQVGTDTVWPDVEKTEEKVGGMLYLMQLEQCLNNLGVDIRYSTEGVALIADESGAVVGAEVRGEKGDSIKIGAGAVVLATGGFGGSQEYCDKLVPAINQMGFQFQGNVMNTGDAMTMVESLDGATYTDCWVIPNSLMPARKLTDADQKFKSLTDQATWGKALESAATSKKLMVNAAGQRFMNEAAPVIALATTLADAQAGPYYVLFDSSDPEATAILETGLETGCMFKADSIEALGEAAGMADFAATFEAYSAAVAAGADEAFGKAAEKLVAYADGPFYLVEYVPTFVATMGGVVSDADCRALRNDGSAIDGLYVIGEATHRFMYNRSFVRHCSNSSGLTMGRMTGQALAAALQ